MDLIELFRKFFQQSEWTQGRGSNDDDDEDYNEAPRSKRKRGQNPPWMNIPQFKKGPIAKIGAVFGLFFLLFTVFPWLAYWVTEYWWYQSLDFGAVFWTRIIPQVILFAASACLSFAVMFANWRAALGIAKKAKGLTLVKDGGEDEGARLTLKGTWIAALAALLLAALNGLASRGQWGMVLRYLNAVMFNTPDPLFGKDIGFYVYSLPFWRFIQGWTWGLLFITAIGAVIIYSLRKSVMMVNGKPWVSPAARGHLALLCSLLLLTWAAGAFMGRYDLLTSPSGIVYGAGYTDMNVRLPAIYLNAGAAVLASVLIAVNLFKPMWKLSISLVGALFVMSWLAGTVAPGLVQQYVVKPNEYERERPYLKYHIDSTLKAYGLDTIKIVSVTPSSGTTADEIEHDMDTVRNVRLWDYGPLLRTYKQLQEIRSYYDFSDVDIDRYTFDGREQQVMLAVRELDLKQLQNPTWVNTHLEFTHGFGIVMNPVNEVAPGGLPVLYIKDLPPKYTVSIDVHQPRIYYSEKASSYALVRTDVKEFDYPMGDSNARNTYDGKGGVSIGSLWRQLLFALRFRDTEILFTNSLTQESRVLYKRNLREAIGEIAPFLIYDSDPYPIVLDGRIIWVQDAYTVTGRYPYSKPLAFQNDPTMDGFGGFNYIRNSVKITMDAYDGNLIFYIMDKEDPIAATWAKIFPDMFKPSADMPQGLRAHLRYPEELFQVQSEIYRVFHMTDTNTFYNKEDVWEVSPSGKDRRVLPNYVTMRLRGEKKPEFALIVPFMPVGRSNLIGWMAGRSDGEFYGELLVYQFPKQELIFGPPQIEALIDQNPEISAQLSLWSQRGSDVIRGDLLVIPIGKSLLYVQPMYLKAERGELPELKRVILSTGGRVAWAETFAEALSKLVGQEVLGAKPAEAAAKPQTPQVQQTPSSQNTQNPTAMEAQLLYNEAMEAQRAGNWALYGEKIKALGELINNLK